jgi:hypothetical protein
MLNINLPGLTIIGLLTYIYGLPFTSLLVSLMNVFVGCDIYSIYFFVNSFGLYMFGYLAMIFCNMVSIMYFTGYNRDSIGKYVDTIKKIHSMSGTGMSNGKKSIIDHLEQLKIHTASCLLVLMIIKTQIAAVLDELGVISAYNSIKLWLDTCSHQMVLTVKYLGGQLCPVQMDELEKRLYEYTQYYESVMTDKTGTDCMNSHTSNSITDTGQLDANLQVLNYMNDMMKNLAEMSKYSGMLDADVMKPTSDRKTRRLLQKENKKKLKEEKKMKN